MKIFKKIIIVFVILVAVFLIVSLFLPSKIEISRTIKINAPCYIVFKNVNNLKSWEKWSPWFRMDSMMEKKYSDPEEGQGASMSWKSKNKDVGSGSLVITKSAKPDSVLVDLYFIENGKAKLGFYLNSDSNGTIIIWDFKSDLGINPIYRYFGLIMKSYVASDFEKGLSLLKNYCESLPKEPQ